jgi:hypothetical protein
MATSDQIRQRQLEQERLIQEQRLEDQREHFQRDLDLRQQQELDREQALQLEQPQLIANEFSDQLQQRLLDAIWAGITGATALVAATGQQMGKAAEEWMSDRLNEGITVLEKTIQDYLKANPNPPAQVLERMAKELGTLEQAMRDRGIPGAPQVEALRQYVLNQREGITIQSDVRPRPELDPNVINIPTADQQVQRPAHTGHGRQEPVDPNAINQPGNEPPLQKPQHTGHSPEQPAVTDVFAQPEPEFVRIKRPGGEVVREFPKVPAQRPPSLEPEEPGDSVALQRNMERLVQRLQAKNLPVPEGLRFKEDYDAHHIVEGNDNSVWMQQARAVLKRHDIGINAGENGVYLPNPDAVLAGAKETPHANVHTNEYKREILQRLLQAEQRPWNGKPPTENQQRQNVINELGKIRQELIQHKFPYQNRTSELQPDGVEVAQQPTRRFSPEFYEQWNALLAQSQQSSVSVAAIQQQRQADLADHAIIMDQYSTTFAQSLSEFRATHAAHTQAWASLLPVQPIHVPSTAELRAEIAHEAYEAEHGFDNAAARQFAEIQSRALGDDNSLELVRRPTNTDG